MRQDFNGEFLPDSPTHGDYGHVCCEQCLAKLQEIEEQQSCQDCREFRETKALELAEAQAEVDRLRAKVKELEQALRISRSGAL